MRHAIALSLTLLTACSRAPHASPVVATTAAGAVASPRGGGPESDALEASVPRIDGAMKTRLRAVMARGKTLGARADVFAKIGDSITESASFLQDVGKGWYDLGAYRGLEPTVAYFHQRRVDDDGSDSFARASVAATAGWTSADVLDDHPPPGPLVRELDALHPAVALIMFGTNDVDRSAPEALGANLDRIVAECLARGVIPVLSTIPDRADTAAAARRVPLYNDRIRAVAAQRTVPLMDLHAALGPLPRHGLDADGIHPDAWNNHGDVQAAHFTPEALRHGYNVRNLLALRTLERLRTVVFQDGAPDR